MIRLSKTSEYALMALKHLSRIHLGGDIRAHGVEKSSAREIAEIFELPFEMTAKTLQKMRDLGWIESTQGPRGGYSLVKPLDQISLSEFIEKLEGSQAIVTCSETSHDQKSCCTSDAQCVAKTDAKKIMLDLNQRVLSFFSNIMLADLGSISNMTAGTSASMKKQKSSPALSLNTLSSSLSSRQVEVNHE